MDIEDYYPTRHENDDSDYLERREAWEGEPLMNGHETTLRLSDPESVFDYNAVGTIKEQKKDSAKLNQFLASRGEPVGLRQTHLRRFRRLAARRGQPYDNSQVLPV